MTSELELLTHVDMIVLAEKTIRDRRCHTIRRYPKSSNKCMEDYDLSKESSYLMYWDFNNLCGCAMSQKLPVDGFKWGKKKSRFTEKFIPNLNL